MFALFPTRIAAFPARALLQTVAAAGRTRGFAAARSGRNGGRGRYGGRRCGHQPLYDLHVRSDAAGLFKLVLLLKLCVFDILLFSKTFDNLFTF